MKTFVDTSDFDLLNARGYDPSGHVNNGGGDRLPDRCCGVTVRPGARRVKRLKGEANQWHGLPHQNPRQGTAP